MKIPKTLVVAVVVCGVLVTGAFLLWLYNNDAGLIPEEGYVSYAEALTLLDAGDYRESIRTMREALIPIEAMADSPQKYFLKANVEYNLAATTNLSGDYKSAIQLFKQIVANTDYQPTTRAKSVQYMAEMILSEIDVLRREEIQSEVFKDSPYASMRVSSDVGLSARRLAEYASSLYPIALSELRIAERYVKDIIFNNLSTTTPQGIGRIALIQGKLVSANADISRTMSLSTAHNEIPTYLTRKAVVIDGLSQIGVVPILDAEIAYQEALSAFETYERNSGSDVVARFYYASFLASVYGKSRVDEVRGLAYPLYGGEFNVSGNYITRYLRILSSVSPTATPRTTRESDKLRAIHIALIDSTFKAFLLSLGWKEVEFKV